MIVGSTFDANQQNKTRLVNMFYYRDVITTVKLKTWAPCDITKMCGTETYLVCKLCLSHVYLQVKRCDHEGLPFAWKFWEGFFGTFISSGKNGSKYDAVPSVKNDPVELGRLGRLVPGLTKSLTVGERMAQVRFL